MKPSVKAFFHTQSHTFSYVVWDETSPKAVLIDTVLDYDQPSGRTSTRAADKILEFLQLNSLDVEWILETHAHADHLSAAPYLKSKLAAKIGIGEGICAVQKTFQPVFNFDVRQFKTDGSQFDRLFQDGDKLAFASDNIQVIATPGHTDDSVTYVIGDCAFIGDTLFMPDYGTARCDFPGGSAEKLYESVQRLYRLPAKTKLFLCHDYLPEESSRDYRHCITVAEQKENNIHIDAHRVKSDFVNLREQRDLSLDVPDLIIPSVQVNIRAGHLPPSEDNGHSYLKIPINIFGKVL